jgi:alkylation response protein AidB-like acyl-CoA dehydrogenase
MPTEPPDEEFRARVRSFLAENAEREQWIRDEHGRPRSDDAPNDERVARARRCLTLLFEAGLGALTWPERFGGQGLTNRQQVIFNQEAAEYDLPLGMFVIGHGMCAPTLLAHGTDDQRDRYLPRLLRGHDIWCQMFSEPEAGSDLASISCRAEPDGDGWVMNGQKVWTSGAHNSTYGMLLARSDPTLHRHGGMTMYIIEMNDPGVEVRPLRQMSGTSRFNEVFFDDCHVGPGAVLGEVGQGWRTAMTTLMNERVSIGTSSPGGTGHPVSALIAEARQAGRLADVAIVDRLVGVQIRQRMVALLGERVTQALLAGEEPGPEGSLAKLAGTQLSKDSAALAMEIVGPASIGWPVDDRDQAMWATVLTNAPGLSIAGGTDEIMRNIVAERVLGLPRDPRPDESTRGDGDG